MNKQNTVPRYYIQITWKERNQPYNRRKCVWPILFKSAEEAWDHFFSINDPFMNLHHKPKLNASIEYVRIPKP